MSKQITLNSITAERLEAVRQHLERLGEVKVSSAQAVDWLCRKHEQTAQVVNVQSLTEKFGHNPFS